MKKSIADDRESQKINANATLEKMAPKYCTVVQAALLNNNSIVLSMIYKEPNDVAVLLERVVIDVTHAENLAHILLDAVKIARIKE